MSITCLCDYGEPFTFPDSPPLKAKNNLLHLCRAMANYFNAARNLTGTIWEGYISEQYLFTLYKYIEMPPD
jgi:hypothetical protein